MSLYSKLANSTKIVAISNYSCSERIEEFIAKYDFVIRFNAGSNEFYLLEKLKHKYSKKNDLCVINGWKNGHFGNLNAYKNKEILFSRPRCVSNIQYYFKDICVNQEVENLFKKYTDFINYIPLTVFYDFYNNYGIDHPTTGLITIYYLVKYLNKNVDCINFFIGQNLPNTFLSYNKNNKCPHNLKLESNILDILKVNRIIL